MRAFLVGLLIVTSWTVAIVAGVAGLFAAGYWLFAIFLPPWVGVTLAGIIIVMGTFGDFVFDCIEAIQKVGQRALDKREAE